MIHENGDFNCKSSNVRISLEFRSDLTVTC